MNNTFYYGTGNAEQLPTANQTMLGNQPPTTTLVNGQFQAFDGYGNAMPIEQVAGAQAPIFHYDPNNPNGYFDQYYNWYPMAPPPPPPQQAQNFFNGGIGIDMADVYQPLDLGNLAELPGNAEFMKYYKATEYSQTPQQQQAVSPQHQTLQAPSPTLPPTAPAFSVQMQTPPVPPQTLAPTPVAPPALPAAPVNRSGSQSFLPPFTNPLVTNAHPTVKVQLRDQWLWNEFNEKINEMVVTLQGKEVFPRMVYKVTGLNKNSRYQWSIRLVRVAPFEKKWNSKKSIWQSTEVQDKEKLESNELFSDIKSGEQWQKEGVNVFEKTKVVNTVSDRNKDKVSVGKNVKLEDKNKPVLSLHEVSEHGGQMIITQHGSYQFSEMEFVVVTQYKSSTIRAMKTKYNNFNRKDRKEKASKKLESADEQLGGRTGCDSGYVTSSRDSTVSPTSTSSGVVSFSSQYYGFDGSAPSTSNQY